MAANGLSMRAPARIHGRTDRPRSDALGTATESLENLLLDARMVGKVSLRIYRASGVFRGGPSRDFKGPLFPTPNKSRNGNFLSPKNLSFCQLMRKP